MTDDGPGASARDVGKAQFERLGRVIRERRKQAEMSLRDLAARTDVSNPYLSQLERGLHQPSVRVLKAIADALNMSAEALMVQAGLLDEPDDGEAAAVGVGRGAGRPRPDRRAEGGAAGRLPQLRRGQPATDAASAGRDEPPGGGGCRAARRTVNGWCHGTTHDQAAFLVDLAVDFVALAGTPTSGATVAATALTRSYWAASSAVRNSYCESTTLPGAGRVDG